MSEPASDLPTVVAKGSQERLTLRFDGKGVVDGTINARAMGQALQGMADLVQAIAKTGEFDDHATPELRVVATEEGSFELELLIQALGEWWAMARPLLTSPDAEAAVNLATFAGIAAGVFKWARDKGGRRVTEKRVTGDGNVEAVLDDGTTMTASPEVVEAAEMPRVQQAVKEVTAPLHYLGIQTLNVETVNINVTINSEEARKIPDPEPEPDPTRKTKTYDTWATFQRPDFGGVKWGVAIPGDTFQATIEDQAFLSRVEAGIVSLSAYDEFRVSVREEPYITRGGQRRKRRYIDRVLDHRQPERDDSEPGLPFAEGGDQL